MSRASPYNHRRTGFARGDTDAVDLWRSSPTAASCSACQRSAKRLDAGERAADDERVHVGCALVGDDGLEVVHVADDGVLERDAVGAEHLARGTGDVESGVDVAELAH